MKLELLNLKAGKDLILGISICAATLFTLNSCQKEDLRINPNHPVAGIDQEDAGIRPINPGKSGDQVKVKDIDPQLPVDTTACGGFRTQTQGGWGSTPHGNNPGTYVHKNFSAAFPNGLTVGCTYKITLTSAQAVTNYLPAGGTPAILTADYIDPTNLQNNLASQLVALTLSVQFDAYDAQFSSSTVQLGNMLIGSGTFKGMKVSQLLIEANNLLGGCPSIYTAAQISDALASINENFVDGIKNGGFLVCPDKIIDGVD